mgnify:CR=1 FL=1
MATYLNVSIELLGNLLMEFPRKRGFYGLRTELQRICHHFQSETRLRVIDMLSCKEMSACDILSNFTLSQSTLSYHMKILIEAGVVDARREGLWTKYSINDDTFNRIMDFMPELYKLKDKCICRQIKYCKTPEECGEGKDPFGN